MFDKKNLKHYLLAFTLIVLASYVGNTFKKKIYNEEDEEYDMIKQYLLNESPLYGSNKPKLWIHSKYEINSRKWLDFQSRNTNNLNQPYLNLTIQSIINHCSNDFHICLIDDETFSKLIPGWDVNISTVAEPMKTHLREVAFLKIIYNYGGMIVPDSFLCSTSLLPLYKSTVSSNKPFICEKLNRHDNKILKSNKVFIPNIYFMGSVKKHPIIDTLITLYSAKTKDSNFTDEFTFTGKEKEVIKNIIDGDKINLVDGKLIGIKNTKNKPILLEDLLEDKFLELDDKYYGIYIPGDEILKRNKYNWFSVLDQDQILKSNLTITKYIKSSMIDYDDVYKKSFASVTSI